MVLRKRFQIVRRRNLVFANAARIVKQAALREFAAKAAERSARRHGINRHLNYLVSPLLNPPIFSPSPLLFLSLPLVVCASFLELGPAFTRTSPHLSSCPLWAGEKVCVCLLVAILMLFPLAQVADIP